jgi:hypothetical protein
MRFRSNLRWVAITAFVLAVAGTATAQSGSASGGASAQVGFEHQQQLSPQDELSQADAMLAHMDQASGTVRRQLEQARTTRDVVKTLCLNDKLSQIDVATRSARDRQTALQAAVQRNDAEGAGHEFAVLSEHRRRSDQLTAEANQCIGEEVAFVGQTQVAMSVDPNIPAVDMTAFPATDSTFPIYNPPLCVSCNGSQ